MVRVVSLYPYLHRSVVTIRPSTRTVSRHLVGDEKNPGADELSNERKKSTREGEDNSELLCLCFCTKAHI